MPRPEDSGPPANFYDAREAAKYTSSSRIIRVQAEIAARCVELLNFPAEGGKRFVLDVGCGSGLSGAALERAGHAWVGCDVSRDMLRIAARRAARRGDDAADMDDLDSYDMGRGRHGNKRESIRKTPRLRPIDAKTAGRGLSNSLKGRRVRRIERRRQDDR